MSDWSSKERALLDAAKSEWGPTPAVAAAAREAVATKIEGNVPGSGEPAPGPAPAPASPAAPALGTKAIVGGLVAVGLVAIGLAWLNPSAETKMPAPIAPVSVVVPAASPMPIAVASATATPTVAVSVDSLPNAAAQVPSSRAPSAPVASASSDPPSDTDDSLGQELDILRNAQNSLHRGAPNDALTALASHARRFPNGKLREERMTLQILALCDSGQVEAARAVRDDLTRISPESSHRSRIANSCVGR